MCGFVRVISRGRLSQSIRSRCPTFREREVQSGRSFIQFVELRTQLTNSCGRILHSRNVTGLVPNW